MDRSEHGVGCGALSGEHADMDSWTKAGHVDVMASVTGGIHFTV